MSLTIEEIKDLRNAIKTEFARRSGWGPELSTYLSSEYEFSRTPLAGQIVLAQDGKATIDPLLAITDISGLQNVKQLDIIPNQFNNVLITTIRNWSSQSQTQSSTSCRSACTGLCYGTCATGCSGCTTSCSGCTSCTSGCGSGCTGGCTGTSKT